MSLNQLERRVPQLTKLLASDVEAKRYDSSKSNALLDPHTVLTPESRAIIEAYYRQDFVCLGYTFDAVQDVEWHQHASDRATDARRKRRQGPKKRRPTNRGATPETPHQKPWFEGEDSNAPWLQGRL